MHSQAFLHQLETLTLIKIYPLLPRSKSFPSFQRAHLFGEADPPPPLQYLHIFHLKSIATARSLVGSCSRERYSRGWDVMGRNEISRFYG